MIRAFDAVIVASAAVLFLIAGFGGFELEIGGLTVRARDWLRPAVALAIGLAGRLVVRPPTGPPASPRNLVAHGMLALIIAASLAYVQFHVRVAGGLDSYGYVSAANMIASGRLHEPQPLASVLPFADSLNAATPLGHVPFRDGQSSVPRFPLGLPLVMAVFGMFHPMGPFFVPLVMGYAAIAIAYAIVRASSDHVTGLFAAALVAVEPVFAVSAIYPMSDVPATCWLLAAIWAAESDKRVESPLWGIASGVCAGMAILTRPVMLPAVVVFLLLTMRRGRLRCVVARTATATVFVLVQLLINVILYGGATTSGYGGATHMFTVTPSHVAAAISNFGSWIVYSRTVPVWLAWPAALAVLRRERWAWDLSAIAAAAAAPYLFYIVFDNWASLRFLLPAIVIALLLCARALRDVLMWTERAQSWCAIALLATALACAVAASQFIIREGVARGVSEEEKYALVGAWFRENTSDRAVALSSLHSGTIRLYSGRQTIRWDHIPENALDATVERLVAFGYEPYLALDMPTEPPMFEERFRSQSAAAEPIARVRVVNIYRFVSPSR